MKKSSIKFYFQSTSLIKRSNLVKKKNSKRKISVKILKKNNVITPKFVGLTAQVYNGYKFQNLQINKEMVGYRFGNFIYTRKQPVWKKK